MAVALLLGAGAGAVSTSSAVAEDGNWDEDPFCVNDARCVMLGDDPAQCTAAVFDTWCDMVIYGEWCNTWTTGECLGEPET